MQEKTSNFILTYIKDGIAYPVMLNEEQQETFELTMSFIPGTIQVVNEPIGMVMTVAEYRKMKEGNK
ncbi:MAG: hypothetical protein K0R54_2101 [Clostridiaceae bacterium]|jgi:hypothetical protein|nr:hypothetical protein [Clostridiaceae bacterium]